MQLGSLQFFDNFSFKRIFNRNTNKKNLCVFNMHKVQIKHKQCCLDSKIINYDRNHKLILL